MTRVSVRYVLSIAAAVPLAFSAAACSQGDTQPPVATVTFSANKARVPLGSPLELTYRFNVAPDAKFDNDYRVFVHFVDPDGGVLWNDDHDPSPPTTQWRPGQTIQYTRTRFLPVVPFLGEVKVTVGLYRDTARLPLQGLDYWMRVKWHLDRGEFRASGYFRGVELNPAPPRLLLVSPAFDFHPTTETILRYFSPQVEVERLGLGAEWRRELQVVFRARGAEPPG